MNDGVINSILENKEDLNDEKLNIIIKVFNEKLEQINNNFNNQLKELSEKYTNIHNNPQPTTIIEEQLNTPQPEPKTADQLYNELRKRLGLDNE